MLNATSAALLIASASAAWQDARPWLTVTSPRGQFSVEMPVKPELDSTKTQGGPFGKVTEILIGCDTPPAAYLVKKIELPAPIQKGQEKDLLNTERDELAHEFNGKVITQKDVRLDNGMAGLDFTVRGRPKGGDGVSTVRVREYIGGKAIFALIAVSAPNRDLPDEAGKFLGSLTIGTKVVRRERNESETNPTGKPLEGWGEAVDPDGDCTFRPAADALAIEVPGTLHDLNADIAKWNAPRVLREVEGDFVATVKVAGKFAPGAKSNNPKSIPFNSGGLFVWRDSDNYIRLERGVGRRGAKVNTMCVFEEREGGHRGALHNTGLPEGPVYLRLERKGARLIGAHSSDGKKWTALKPIDIKWPAKVKVGLAAINSGNEPLTVEFEEFHLKSTGKAATPKDDAKPSPKSRRSASLDVPAPPSIAGGFFNSRNPIP